MITLLSRADVERLLSPEECIAAVEDAFCRLAQGRVPPPGILGMDAGEGSFHVKAGFLFLDRPYFAAKLNANFPQNGTRHGLPTIQGAVILFDAANGDPLSIMDSAPITALRTAAATAIAARHLAKRRSEAALICGCGTQAAAQLRALLAVRKPNIVRVYDKDSTRAAAFVAAMTEELGIAIRRSAALEDAVGASDIVITCTTSRRFFITRDMVRPGTFVAAVGADHEEKQEIEPQLLAEAKVVTDATDQACRIGDLHHAIAAGIMARESVHAELSEVVAGLKPGRIRDDEIIVFDSTGTGLQDVAAAVATYRRSQIDNAGSRFAL